MAKRFFVCNACGAEFGQWMGQCLECKEWNCVHEMAPTTVKTGKAPGLNPTPISDIDGEDAPRKSTRIPELDRVLGGGLVHGSAVLIGGAPGIGKSTLLLQAAAKTAEDSITLYITGEESARQMKMRGDRLSAIHPQLLIVAGNQLDSIQTTIKESKASVVIIDSIQTLASNAIASAPGTVSQVRECAGQLIQQAKQQGHVLILVGHITKEGTIAGPRILEHMVDTVLYFEGDKSHQHRLLRTNKNRFGPAGEMGVFEMHDDGLVGIQDVSKLFLADRHRNTPGSVVLSCLEGTRPFLVETQALVAPTVYATPKRSAVGFDTGRLSMLAAVIERRVGLSLAGHDIYVNVVGGARLNEPAADLAIALAMISSFKDKPLQQDMAVFGEIGLTGEIRPVSQPEIRMREAANLGFKRLLFPELNLKRMQKSAKSSIMGKDKVDLDLIPTTDLSESMQMVLS